MIRGSDGVALQQSGIAATFKCIPGCDGLPGAYEIVFDKMVDKCAFVATVANESPGRGSTAPNGQIGVRPLATGPHGVSVTTFNAAGVRADRTFMIAVFC